MLNWIARSGSTANDAPSARQPGVAVPRAGVRSNEYQLLHEYLEKRFANTVVLRFTEIEDLLGFKLPDLARLRADWWSDDLPKGAQGAPSDSWSLAGRTATPNLAAQTVVFDRDGF